MNHIDGYMQLDTHTIQSLELVTSTRTAAHGKSTGKVKRSVFDVINHTKTRGGARMLRTSLLQPLKDEATINMRYVWRHTISTYIHAYTLSLTYLPSILLLQIRLCD